MNISQVLYGLMKKQGETNYQLAKELGVSQSTVAGWVSGKRIPQLRHLHSIAAHYGIDVDTLYAACDPQKAG